MSRRTFITLAVVVPLLVCGLVPSLIFGILYDQWGTNLFWGLIFGFGWWVAQSIGGPEHWRAAALIGELIWPALVLAGLFFLGRSVWHWGDGRMRSFFLVVLAISSLPIVPAETAMSLYANASVPPDFNYLMAAW
jgi:hypothetical protein